MAREHSPRVLGPGELAIHDLPAEVGNSGDACNPSGTDDRDHDPLGALNLRHPERRPFEPLCLARGEPLGQLDRAGLLGREHRKRVRQRVGDLLVIGPLERLDRDLPRGRGVAGAL